MSLAAYCKCRIRFQSDDRSQADQEYSDRSLIELRQHEFPDHSIRAIDVENGNKEIFNIPVSNNNRYTFGRGEDDSDEIRGARGVYRISLEKGSRDGFHTALQTCFEMLGLNFTPTTEPTHPSGSGNAGQPPSTTLKNTDSDKTLVDIQLLGECIKRGDEGEAGNIAAKLAEKQIQLQLAGHDRDRREQPFSIRIQVDSNVRVSNEQFQMDVYPSTTVSELRGAIDYLRKKSPGAQYWFVNGHLAYEKSSMAQLGVERDTLFVLFIVG